MNPNKQQPFRHPGVQEASEERVLLVTRSKAGGQERIDWWPSVAEAEASDHIVLEVRRRIHVEKEKKNWTGSASFWRFILGKSGTQDRYTRESAYEQKEFYDSVLDKKPEGK